MLVASLGRRIRPILVSSSCSRFIMSDSGSIAPKRALSPAGAAMATFATNGDVKRTKLDDDFSSVKPGDAKLQSVASGPFSTGTNGSSSTNANALASASQKNGRGVGARKGNRGRGKGKAKAVKPGGAEEVGAFDVIELLGAERVEALEREQEEQGQPNWCKKQAENEWGFGAEGKQVEVQVIGMNSHGDGLALLTPSGSIEPTRLVTVPFALPGETVIIKVTRHEPDFFMSHADLVQIVKPSERRLAEAVELEGRAEPSEALKATRAKFGNRVQCQYFGVCSGCQYQPLAYQDQLEIKRTVVRKAFANFSLLPASSIPPIGATLASPLEYQYRTKLTPHFQTPPTGPMKQWKGKGKGKGADASEPQEPQKEWELTIGFEQKGRKRIVDIEECVIATKVINEEYKRQREEVKANISKFKRGSTLLLRDSLPPRSEGVTKASLPADVEEAHVCITDHHATVRERVGSNEFEQVAGSFFQNNASILPSLMAYIAKAIRAGSPKTTHLIDAYCGSGLFAISLADQFEKIEGVEIDKQSVKWAKTNADWNKGPGRGEVGFRDGKAEDIFGTIDFPQDATTILIDPPRKGCDELFLSQLLKFNPATIIYVSCNVHTQARDIGWIMRKSEEQVKEEGKGKKGYWIESLRAADLFANTHHAEGVAVLRRDV